MPEVIRPETAKTRWVVEPARGDSTYGKAFRATRVAVRRTVLELSGLTGVPAPDLIRLEAGRLRFPDQQTLRAWLNFLLSLCTEPGCNRLSCGGGRCMTHYVRERRAKSA